MNTVDDLMAKEMEIDVAGRSVMPMLGHFCPICVWKNCSSLQCPLIQAKWFDKYIPFAEWKTKCQSKGKPATIKVTPVIPPPPPKEVKVEQLSLF